MAGGCCNNEDEDSRGSDLLCVLTCGGAGRAFWPRSFSGLGVCSFTSNCRASSAFGMIGLTSRLDRFDAWVVWLIGRALDLDVNEECPFWLFSAIDVDGKGGKVL